MNFRLHTEKITLGYDGPPIISVLDVAIPTGKITAVVGPNGCGKSTLLRGSARLLRPKTGNVYLDGKAIHRLPTAELAKEIGILPQSPQAPEGLTVRELVAQGRYPHQSWLRQWSARMSALPTRRWQLPICWISRPPARHAFGWTTPTRLDSDDPRPRNRNPAPGRTDNLS